MKTKVTRSRAFYRIACDERVSSVDLDRLYTGGICGRCGTGRGFRIQGAIRRVLEVVNSDVVYTRNGILVLLLMSNGLRESLMELGLVADDFAECQDANGQSLFELRTERRRVPWVGLNERVGIKAKAVFCRECGAQSFVFAHRERAKGARAFVRESDAARITENVTVAGIVGAPQPLLDDVAYVTLLRGGTIRGVKFEPVGIVPDADVDERVEGLPLNGLE